MNGNHASSYTHPNPDTWQSGLAFQNDFVSSDDPKFTFEQPTTQADNQYLTFRNEISEDETIAERDHPRRTLNRDRQLNDEKLSQVPRTGTGLSSSLDSFRNQMSLGNGRSPIAHFVRDWWLELISCIFLLAALVAIIVTAHEYQDHPLPNLPSGISINSILAIFNVILKAAMLLVLAQGLSHLKWTWFKASRPLSDLAVYDNASRGPLGSIWLIFRSRGRDFIASMGALLTIAAVILDPMAQQVIRYYSCQQIRPDLNSTLPRTNAYMELGAHVNAGINSVSQALQSAINGGVFVPGAQVSFDCSSGNCTFADIAHTIGMHSVCTDISDELVFANITIDTYDTLNATLPSGLYTSFNQYKANVTLMTMNFNVSTSTFEVIVGPRVTDPQTPRNFCGTGLDETLGPNPSWDCRGWGAARCRFDPVVYTISNASIDAGKLRETLTPAVTIDYATSGYSGNSYTLADLDCLSSSQISALRDAGYQIPSSRWLPYNVSMNFQGELVAADSTINNATRDVVPGECIYQVYSPTINSLYYFLSDYFSGSIVPLGSRWTGSTVAQQIFDNYGVSFDSVDSMMRNVTSSMTTYMRQNGLANNSAPASGQVWDTDTCIRVRWAYVSFPASLTVLTIFFFVTMVIITSRAQQGVHHDFKSSPLALLFHGLDDDATRRVEVARRGESNEVGDLREEANGMWVRLRPTDKGWKFVAVEATDQIR